MILSKSCWQIKILIIQCLLEKKCFCILITKFPAVAHAIWKELNIGYRTLAYRTLTMVWLRKIREISIFTLLWFFLFWNTKIHERKNKEYIYQLIYDCFKKVSYRKKHLNMCFSNKTEKWPVTFKIPFAFYFILFSLNIITPESKLVAIISQTYNDRSILVALKIDRFVFSFVTVKNAPNHSFYSFLYFKTKFLKYDYYLEYLKICKFCA